MRISDCSSDVCSSDLQCLQGRLRVDADQPGLHQQAAGVPQQVGDPGRDEFVVAQGLAVPQCAADQLQPLAGALAVAAQVGQPVVDLRLEERRVGKQWVETCGYRWLRYN